MKYPKPKILMLDMPADSVNVLRAAGYNTSCGSFGPCWKVDANRNHSYVWTGGASHDFDLEEQEIIFAHIANPKPMAHAPAHTIENVRRPLWESNEDGVIDPRPLAMSLTRDALDTVFKHNGLAILFVDVKQIHHYHEQQYNQMTLAQTESNWSILSDLQWVDVDRCQGRELRYVTKHPLVRLLKPCETSTFYTCSLKPFASFTGEFFPIIGNKYEACVAAEFRFKDPDRLLLLLPQIGTLEEIIVPLLEEFCVQRKPQLFPLHQCSSWLHLPEYEIPNVIELSARIEQAKKRALEEELRLRGDIEKERAENQDWYTLLGGTDDDLVQAVIRALGVVGFSKVVDADKESRNSDPSASLKEDIQIHDDSPILVVDVKGVNGHPDDDEARQAEKHAKLRTIEWKRYDVQALTIINYQRNTPPHNRDKRGYRDEMIAYAVEMKFGLMSTWDLFNIVRNMKALSWPPEAVRPIFYRTGRINPIPEHYREIAQVVRTGFHFFGIVPSTSIRKGDHLAIENGDSFTEIKIGSIQVHHVEFDIASQGDECGIKALGAVVKVKKGAKVYAVSPHEA
jgi:hypothetical protein